MELFEKQQIQHLEQQCNSYFSPLKDRDQRDLQGSMLLSDQDDSKQEQDPVGFASQTNKRLDQNGCAYNLKSMVKSIWWKCIMAMLISI